MLYVFVAALVVGGVLLGASILIGDGHGDAGGHDFGIHVDGDGIDVVIGTLRSLRFWTFFLAFFGLAGTVFQQFGLVSSTIVATLLAIATGAFAGYGATWAFRFVGNKDSNSMAGADDFVGKSGRILVAVAPGAMGKLRVQVKGSTVDLLATSDETFAIGDDATVIEMDGTNARIARVEGGASSAPRGE